MSADNWAICPRCFYEARQAAAADLASIETKLTPEEFAKVKSALPDVDPEKFRTFREDYEFYGVAEGVLSWSYGGRCEVCGLSVETQGSKEFWSFPVEAREAAG